MNTSYVLFIKDKPTFIIIYIEDKNEWCFSTYEKIEVRNPKTGITANKRVRYPRVESEEQCLIDALNFGARKGWFTLEDLKPNEIKKGDKTQKYHRKQSEFPRKDLLKLLVGK